MVEMDVRLGSLCSGVDGLAMGIERTLGARTMWQSEIDPHASKVLAAHWSCPNLGDLTLVDWTAVAPVDVMCAGYPCQPFSHAGRRLGENDVRHLWPFVLDAVRVVRPRVVLLENVAGHLSLGFGRVLGDLAEVGYDCRWTCIRASDVGACHRRERVFIAATDTQRRRQDGRRPSKPTDARRGDQARVGWTEGTGANVADADDGIFRVDSGRLAGATASGQWTDPRAGGRPANRGGAATADADDAADHGQRARSQPWSRGEAATADADRGRLEECGEQDGGPRGRVAASRRSDADGRCAPFADASRVGRRERPGLCEGGSGRERRGRPADDHRAPRWGDYEPAIRRHEQAVGRPAPDPVDDRGRLSPHFVEWMMMFPEGHVTDHLGRTKALKALGNAVVPAVAERACRVLLTAQDVAA